MLKKLLTEETQVNVGLAAKLTAMRISSEISELATNASRKEVTDGRAALALSRGETETGQTDLVASAVALASSRAETKAGRAELVTSAVALASSQAETKAGHADLVASAVALALSRAETKAGHADLVASAVALAVSRAETETGQTDLVASAEALALSRAETSEGQIGLIASGVLNKALKLANVLLETNEAVLEKLVEERTAALMREIEDRHRAEETLRQGEKLQAIGQITGGIAHDFNNILQVVMGGVELLRPPRLTHERHTVLLERIDKAAENAKVLTSRLLTFARKQALQPKVFDLNERLAGMSDLLRPMLGPNVELVHDFAPEIWPVMVDPNQLEVAILNLAVNARDAMPQHGGVLTFQTHNVVLESTSERDAGEYICLAVRDTGIGMSPAVLARVFEPFFTTKGIGKGTGLGLAQVYGFAKQSGGDVTVESVSGQGTTIFFHLLRPTAKALASAEKREELRAVGSTHCGSGKVVLVVDDNLDVASLTASMLEDHGYKTEFAASGAEALALLDTGMTVHCLFSDIVMPGAMNGLQLATILRMRYPLLPVVLSTGYSRALTEGNDQVSAEVLSKPYRSHELVAALDRAFLDVGLVNTSGCPA